VICFEIKYLIIMDSVNILADIIGIIGVSLVIQAYLLIQAGKVTINSNIYLYSNFFGSLMILFSLFFHWNLASVVIEVTWLLISTYGIIRKLTQKAKN